MTLYNNRLIPFWLRIDTTRTEEVNDESGNRTAEEWGYKRPPEKRPYMVLIEENVEDE